MDFTRSQKVDGAEVSYSVAGRGSPVVVLESGLGDGKSTWSTIVSMLADRTAVFSYDRPGYSPGLGFKRFSSDRKSNAIYCEEQHQHTVLE